MIFLFFYLFVLQIVRGFEYRKKADEILKRDIPYVAQRGLIFDSNYDIPLVYNIDSFAVNIIPGDIPKGKIEDVFERCSRVLKMPVAEIRKKIPEKYYRLYQPRQVKSAVSFDTIAYIAEHIDDFPGVSWNNKPIRGYLSNSSISHVVGYVGDITDDELNTLYNKGYTYNSTIGKTGLEKTFDETMRGRDGKHFKFVDVKEKQLTERTLSDIPPVPGKNLVLSIDRNIQTLSEKALGERIGSVVVLKPATGEVIAMVSYPWYDPSIFYSDQEGSEFTKVSLDPRFPFLNRAIQALYPPASVFKTVMATALIEEDAFPLTEKIECTGQMELGDRVAHCWKEFGHGRLDFLGAFANSCNIYFYTVGVNYLKIENILRYSKEFGLGRLTGIDLPQEQPGFLPSPEWKEKRENMKWLGGDTMNISIGQGWLTVTPIQLANVVSMVVNDGVTYKPFVVKEIRDPVSGELISQTEKKILNSTFVKKDTFKLVKQAMRKVVTEGTGYLITTKAVDVAGKTGTPETGVEDKYHSWFASYAPFETSQPEDRVVIVVMIEASNTDKWYASKTANIIYQGIFANQTYEEAMVTLYPWMKNQFDTESIQNRIENASKKTDTIIPKTETIIPRTNNVLPKTALPKTTTVVPKTDSVIPQFDNTVPKTDNALPKTENVMPKTDNVAPQTENNQAQENAEPTQEPE
jgi:penicillin-binding protein 2